MRSSEAKRQRRHWKIRKRVFGTNQRPRLAIHRTLKHLYVQLIDDDAQKTLCAFSTNHKEFRGKHPKGGNVASAVELGEWLAKEAKAKGVEQVVFDRAGYLYHGRVKALAEAAREKGLQF